MSEGIFSAIGSLIDEGLKKVGIKNDETKGQPKKKSSSSQSASKKLNEVKKESYNDNWVDQSITEDNWEFENGKDNTHELMRNITWARNQLGKEILESFLEYDERNVDKFGKDKGNQLEEEFDDDMNLSLKYLNEAYLEEEKNYRENNKEVIHDTANPDPNKSIGDLILEWMKTDAFGNADMNLFGEFIGTCGKWDIGASINFLEKNTTSKSHGMCAKYVRMALEAGGLSTEGRPSWAIDYIKFLPKIGFKPVKIIAHNNNYDNYMKKSVFIGDIAVMANPKGGPGHICLYTGKRWISDFKQSRAWVYSGDCGLLYIFRYQGMSESGIGGMGAAMSGVGTAIKGWGLLSINGISLMVSCEGWTDFSKKSHIGVVGTDATAGNQANIDRAGVYTVGPGLTNAVNKNIRPGVRFTARQIMAMWSTTIIESSKNALRLCPALKSLPQGCRDAAVDCMHSGIGHFQRSGWPSVKTPQQAAAACLKMPMTAKGKVVKGLYDRRHAEAAICLGRAATGSAKRYTDAYYNPSPALKKACGL